MLSKKDKIYLGFGSLFILLLAIFSYYYLDRELAYYFYNLHSPVKELIDKLTILGKSEWYLAIGLILFLWWHYRGRKLLAKKALYILFVNITAGILVWSLKVPFGRLRPKMFLEHQQYGFEGWGFHYLYVSFPSGHSITIFATATALALLIPRLRIPLFILATLVALSRVTLTAHYLSDVLVGSWLGVVVATILYRYMFRESNETN